MTRVITPEEKEYVKRISKNTHPEIVNLYRRMLKTQSLDEIQEQNRQSWLGKEAAE